MVILAKWHDANSMVTLWEKGSGTSIIKWKGMLVDVGTAIAGIWPDPLGGVLITPISMGSRSIKEKYPTATSASTRFCTSVFRS